MLGNRFKSRIENSSMKELIFELDCNEEIFYKTEDYDMGNVAEEKMKAIKERISVILCKNAN